MFVCLLACASWHSSVGLGTPLCRFAQKSDWKKHGHKEACGRLAEQMQEWTNLQALPFEFASTTIARELTRSMWVQWLVESGHHKMGLWQRECGCFSKVSFGELPAVNVGPPWQLMGLPTPDSPPRFELTELRDWKAYYTARGLPLSSPASLLLHFVLSLYKMIHRCKLVDRTLLHVHWLGPEKELDTLPLLHELSWLLPHMQLLITMVGPAVPPARHNEQIRVAHSVEVTLIRGLYHEAAARGEVSVGQADLVVGLNAGFETYPSYRPTVNLLLSSKRPLLCTDYNQESARLAAAIVQQELGRQISCPIETNPFRAPRTEKSSNRSYCIPSCGNAFLYGNVSYK